MEAFFISRVKNQDIPVMFSVQSLNFTAIVYLLHVLPFFVDQTYYRENIRLGKQSFI